MTHHIERRTTPATPKPAAPTLADLMHEGFYALFLLRQGSAPQDPVAFSDRMVSYLDEVEQQARQAGMHGDDIHAASYAFCAAVDETVLRSRFALRDAWEARPLQLRLFGDQLAGEHFFERLEELRHKGSARLQALEVYHLCLLHGFQGRYALYGEEKLKYLCARVGDELAHMRGRQRGFAPHGERPDQVVNALRSGRSLWVLSSLFALSALLVYAGMRASLAHQAGTALAPYHEVVKMPPPAASVTITLP